MYMSSGVVSLCSARRGVYNNRSEIIKPARAALINRLGDDETGVVVRSLRVVLQVSWTLDTFPVVKNSGGRRAHSVALVKFRLN